MISEQTRNKLITIAENEQKVYDNGVADGKQAEYDAFWDSFQDFGNRVYYNYAFAYWKNECIQPKYKVTPTTALALFAHNASLKRIDKDYFDLSNTSVSPVSASSATASICEDCSSLEIFQDVGMRAGYYQFSFRNCHALHTIEVLRFAENVAIDAQCFSKCYALQNLTIEGVIGTNFSIKDSPLSVASLKSIIKHLKSYLGTSSEYAYTLTVKTSAWEALVSAGFTDEDLEWIEEVLEIDKDTWLEFEFAWDNTLEALRWNLVLA